MPTIDDTTVLATGSTTRRPINTRIAETVTNVRDFGAVGDGVTDDRAAIQAAIDEAVIVASSGYNNYGVIFFPEGTYFLDSPVLYGVEATNSIIFRGVGMKSWIQGNFAGFLLDRSDETSPGLDNANPALCVIELLAFSNVSTNTGSGCVRWECAHGLIVRDCSFSGFKGLSCTGHGLTISNCQFPGTGAAGIQVGSMGIFALMGGPSSISGCDILGFHHGIALQGVGASLHGCRFENNGNGITVGHDAYPTTGCSITSCSFEANDCGIFANNMYTSFISVGGVHGHSACPYSGYGAIGTGPLPGADTPPEMVSTYGVFQLTGDHNVWMTCKPFDMFNEAAIRIYDGTQGPNVWISCQAENAHTSGVPFTGSTTTWSIGGTSHKGLTFINCVPAVDPVMTFADLPTTALTGRGKGAKYFITDGGAEAIGATVTAGTGSTFMEVMWTGTEWRRVG